MAQERATMITRDEISPFHTYCDGALGGVVMRTEAAAIWHKTLSTVDMAVAKRYLDARKSLTNGTVIITVASLVKLWGIPRNTLLWELYTGRLDEVMPTVEIEVDKNCGGNAGDDDER